MTEEMQEGDDLLGMLGLNEIGTKLSSEDMFYFYLTQGERGRISMLIHSLNHTMAQFCYLQAKGVSLLAKKYDGQSVKQVQLSQLDMLRIALEYNLYMLHCPKFSDPRVIDGNTYPPCNMEKMVDLLLTDKEIAKLATKKYE